MSDPIAFVRRMLAAGMPLDMALDAAEEFQRGVAEAVERTVRAAVAGLGKDAQAERRREKDRTRKAEKKAGGIPQNSAEPAKSEPTHSLEEITPPSPPKGGSSPKGATPRKRGSKFVPEAWEPKPDHHAQADAIGLSPGEFERALSRFRRHEFPRPYTDWDRCFANWISRETPRQAHDRQPPADAKHEARQANLARALGAIDALAERQSEPPGGRWDHPL